MKGNRYDWERAQILDSVMDSVMKRLNISGLGLPTNLEAPTFQCRRANEEENRRVGKVVLEFRQVTFTVDVVVERKSEEHWGVVKDITRISVTASGPEDDRSFVAWLRRLEKVVGPIEVGWNGPRVLMSFEGEKLALLKKEATRRRRGYYPAYFSS